MDKNKLTYLVKKYFDNTITKEEQQELAALIKNAREDAQLKAALEKTWETYEPAVQMPDEMSNRILQNLFPDVQSVTADYKSVDDHRLKRMEFFDEENNKPRRTIAWRYIGIAAATISVFVTGWWLMAPKATIEIAGPHIISTQKGSRLKAKLPDGTVVWLNAGSHLEYDNDFNKSVRKISLTGEAFFDVAHNKEKPFVIHTAAMDLRVLGTTFNVRAYPDEKNTEAALITGSLQVSLANNSSKIFVLKPSEKISVNNDDNGSVQPASIPTATTGKRALAVSSVTYEPRDSSVVETSWVNNRLVFRGKLFEEVALEMSRWYNVNFEVHDEALLRKKFTGTFETETIEEALTRISESYNFSFTYDAAKKLVIIGK